MTHPSATPKNRRTGRGLMIEGTATLVSRSSAGTVTGPAHARPAPQPAPLDLARRLSTGPYESLLDDAMRLARGCRPLGSATMRAFLPTS